MMMNKPIKLKWFIATIILVLGITLVAGYSILSANYFLLGMDNITSSNMEQAVNRYTTSLHPKKKNSFDTLSDYQVSQEWTQQPEPVRRAFSSPPNTAGVLHKKEYRDANGIEYLYFLMRYESNDETFFISHRLSPQSITTLVDNNITRSFHHLLLISGAVLLLLFFLMLMTFHQISKPIKALTEWTNTLTPSSLIQPTPDFSYPELNHLAELIRTTLSSVQLGLEREQQFLRYTSHELRTPINIIRSNVELYEKLQATKVDQSNQGHETPQIIERIDRASRTMKHLTETLLWLGQQDGNRLSQHPLQLDQLIRQLVDDTQYLLTGKAVTVELDTMPYTATLPEAATRIVLGNLIRNAFQHSWDGKVTIRQKENHISISNDLPDIEDAGKDLGFGLGLQLIKQLSSRLSWSYQSTSNSKEHGVTVTLTEVTLFKEGSGPTEIMSRMD